jgi:hypothetical protein
MPTSCTAPSRRRCAIRGARSSSAVSSRLARRAAGGLQRVAPAEHQRDHRARQQLADSQRAGHRQQRDRVDPHVARAQRASDRRRERHERDGERRRPDRVTGARRAGEVGRAADGDRRRRQQGQRARESLVHRAVAPEHMRAASSVMRIGRA